MALTTRCPQCGTSFKVVPDQLRVRNGLVRCGVCVTVFDGRACLLPGADPLAAGLSVATPAMTAAPVLAAPAVLRGRDTIRRCIEPDAALVQESDDKANEDQDRYDDESDLSRAAFGPEPVSPRLESMAAIRDGAPSWNASRGAASAEPVFAQGVRRDPRHADDEQARGDAWKPDDDAAFEPILGEARTRYSSATDVGRAPPEFLDQDHQERRGLLRKLWGYACLIGLIALGLQGAYAYRSDIANAVPTLRPALEAACKPLGCVVGYARRLDRIAISSSSLQPPAGAAAIDDGRTRLVLNLSLRNRSDKPQHWPALVLDLTDLSDTVVVRRVLMPENYLTPEQLRGPFGPMGDLKISVPIEVTGVQINGYQLDKFFP